MNATTEPQPVCKCPATACRCRHSAVSDKDRDAAVEILKAHGVDIEKPNTNYCVCGVKMSWGGGLLTHRLDVLIAHGWGPRPTVDAEFLGRLVNAAVIEASLDPFVEYFEACGIEVTDE